MTYFDCFAIAEWMFAIGWFLGAIYVQNQNEKKESSHTIKKLEPRTQCEALRLPVAASASAD